MAVVLTAKQRDTLHRAAGRALSAAGTTSDLFWHGDIEEAQLYRKHFEAACRLLDDLGWEEAGAHDSYLVTMPADQFRRLLLALRDDAEEALRQAPPFLEQTRKWGKNDEAKKRSLGTMHAIADDFLDERSTCNELFDGLGA